jgi:phage terminase large subunit
MARVELPSKLQRLFEPSRYKVVHGGRGGAKSWSIARALLIKAASAKLRILCARELQLSIRDSVHRLLQDQIEALDYSDMFDVTHTSIRCATGSEFLFSGMRSNVSKIRSMEAIDIVWVEEAEAVSEDSWGVLIPTIRKEGSEIWISFNPDQETDPTYRRYVTNPPPDAIVVEVGWADNPWFPETLRREKDYLYRVDHDAAEHVWGGKTRTINNAQVLFGKVSVAPFEVEPGWDGPYQGADWGFASDPSVLIRCWIREYDEGDLTLRDLHVEHEAYGVGVEITDTPALFDKIPNARKYTTRADSARPETISHMRNNGYGLMRAAQKGAGSVEDGVAHLRSFGKIVIHPRCKNAIQEARLWCYKKDRLTGDVLPDLIDKHDNCWDAARYALEPVMKNRDGAYKGEVDMGLDRGVKEGWAV